MFVRPWGPALQQGREGRRRRARRRRKGRRGGPGPAARWAPVTAREREPPVCHGARSPGPRAPSRRQVSSTRAGARSFVSRWAAAARVTPRPPSRPWGRPERRLPKGGLPRVALRLDTSPSGSFERTLGAESRGQKAGPAGAATLPRGSVVVAAVLFAGGGARLGEGRRTAARRPHTCVTPDAAPAGGRLALPGKAPDGHL